MVRLNFKISPIVGWLIIGAMFLVIGLVSLLSLPQAPYHFDRGIYILKANTDGTTDIYDYREYTFPTGKPPTPQMPYHLTADLTYSHFTAQQVSISPIKDTADIKDIYSMLHEAQGPSLPVSGEGGHYTIDVPSKEHLHILIHYKVSGITAVGKDFARTYIRLPRLGQSNGVYIKTFVLGFMLPSPIASCEKHPTYESSGTLPCISINRYFVGGTQYIPPSVWGKDSISANGTLWIEGDVPVTLIHEIDAVYPKSLTNGKHINAYFSDIAGDRDNMFETSYEIFYL